VTSVELNTDVFANQIKKNSISNL